MLSEKIQPFCHGLKVCGGLRRGNSEVHDIDIVVYPYDFFSISTIVGQMGGQSSPAKFVLKIGEIPVEMWIANNEIEFEVLKLVRTGSQEFNYTLAMRAHDKSMALKYSNGLFGLYAAIAGFSRDTRKYKWYANPLRRLIWKEEEMITTVFGDSKYLNPQNRNINAAIIGRVQEDA